MPFFSANKIFASTILLLLAIAAGAQVPVINSISPGSSSISQFQKQELSVALTANYSNPYDYDEIVVKAVYTAPSGKKDTVEGFYMTDYLLNSTNGNLTSIGSSGFKIRYAPAETGTYQYDVFCTTGSGTSATVTGNFVSVASAKKGYIKKGNNEYLKFDNGEQYIPIGQNMGWQASNKYLDFKNWTDKMAANNANFIRMWQCAWGLGIEWKGLPYEGLKKYRQDNAFYTDQLLNECEAKNIYLMLCINYHGMVSTNVNPNWSDNPYNAANGGPCANTWDYFSNTTAKNLHKNRLRYIIARWGYSVNIMAWELFNEVEWTDNFNTYKTSIKDWHKEMAGYIKTVDKFDHLVTTSYAQSEYDPATWSLDEIDFTQTHFYNGSPNVEAVLVNGNRNYLSQFNKPTLTGEFGIDGAAISLGTIDPNGIYFHNSIWATLMGGGMGGGASWWWDNYIEPQNLYTHYKAPALITTRVPFLAAGYKVSNATVSGGGTADINFSPAVDWGGATANSFTVGADGSLAPAASQLGKFLYGNIYNTQLRNPPTFTVTYATASQFKVITGGSNGTSPKINIYLDGVMLLNQNASINTTYTIAVPAGTHTIKVDNLGTDWILISSYVFTNLGSPLNTYVLKSTDSLQAAGWVHNKNYNWQYVKDSGIPAAVSGATLTLTGVSNGGYTVKWYECTNGTQLSSSTVTAAGNSLQLACPVVAWDAAFTITSNALATLYTFTGSGNWSDAANWSNNTLPPSSLTGNAVIVIDPPLNGECILNVPQSIMAGATLRVMAGKKLKLNGNLTFRQ
ncbi:MAG: hypothetical protein RL172_1417 [Bacteroidota bacterium]